MSAAVCSSFLDVTNPMSNHSYWQVQNWMLAMSNYPPPPQPDQHHYNALYPSSAGAQQLLGHAQQEQLQYTSLNTPTYPKVESGTPERSSAAQLQNLTAELNQHAALEEQQRHQIQQAAHQIQHQAASQVQSPTGLASIQQQQHAASEQAKSNRLRKACDSCSIRKVKASLHA